MYMVHNCGDGHAQILFRLLDFLPPVVIVLSLHFLSLVSSFLLMYIVVVTAAAFDPCQHIQV